MRRVFLSMLTLPAATALVFSLGSPASASSTGGGGSLPTSAFVIGDQNATVGSVVEFWGAQWAKNNSLTGGPAPASFKGFADTVTYATTGCPSPSSPGQFSSDPGNSSGPPPSLGSGPIEVIITSSATQSGSVVSGDVVGVAMVQPDSGYAPDPGHAGTGIVTAILC